MFQMWLIFQDLRIVEDELKDAEREILDLSKNLERERAEKENLEKKKSEMENEIQNLRDTTLGNEH